jgi:hypothetical protein
MATEIIEVFATPTEVVEVLTAGPIGLTGPQANINYTVVSSSQTITNRQLIAADTSGGSFTLTLPLNPEAGDAVDIFDYANTFNTNPLTIGRNGQNIESLAENLTANVEGAYFTLIYTGSTRGWQVLPRYGVSGIDDVLSTQGDLLYRGASSETRLPIGTAGQVLKVNSGETAPEWGSISGSISVTGSDLTLSGATGTAITNATLATTGVAAGTYTKVTVDTKGRVTTGATATPTDIGAVPTSRTISSGTGLTGGGDLTADRTLAVSYGTTANTACEGNDARLSDARTPLSHVHAASDVTSGEFSPLRIPNFEVKTANYTALTNEKIAADTSGGVWTLTLTATPSNGDIVHFFDYANTFNTNNLTIARNGSNIEGLAEDMICDVGGSAFSMIYAGATNGWQMVPYYGTGIAVGTSATDVLSVSSGQIIADDAGADRIVFWDDSGSKLAYLEAGSGLSISGTTLTVTATGGSTNLWIPASAWIPKSTAGCGVDSRETTTHDQCFDELLFDTGSDEFADALVVMPSNYNNGTVTARFYWTAASGSGGVAWGIQGRAFANDDALDTAAGTAQLVTDTLIAADDMHITSATSAVTIGGTPAANTPIQFTIYRDVSDAGDDLAVDARLLGVEILFN